VTTFAIDVDERVTPIGRFLRRSSLDEPTQLLNVLLGEVRLVGPRLDLPDGLPRYLAAQLRRLDMRPGISGWAAVHGRNDLPLAQRINFDVWYVKQQSLPLDPRILARTLGIVLRGSGVNKAGGTPESSRR
jgi:lipopolysaccharide/colanic/teichoic acid biosynthesis glycosyltransferase